MTGQIEIQGQCDPRFQSVKKAFQENFTQRGDVGAAVCVYLEGKPVVDIWGGYADNARTRTWERDTIAGNIQKPRSRRFYGLSFYSKQQENFHPGRGLHLRRNSLSALNKVKRNLLI